MCGLNAIQSTYEDTISILMQECNEALTNCEECNNSSECSKMCYWEIFGLQY